MRACCCAKQLHSADPFWTPCVVPCGLAIPSDHNHLHCTRLHARHGGDLYLYSHFTIYNHAYKLYHILVYHRVLYYCIVHSRPSQAAAACCGGTTRNRRGRILVSPYIRIVRIHSRSTHRVTPSPRRRASGQRGREGYNCKRAPQVKWHLAPGTQTCVLPGTVFLVLKFETYTCTVTPNPTTKLKSFSLAGPP